MRYFSNLRYGLMAGFLWLPLVLSACDTGGSDPNSADMQSGRVPGAADRQQRQADARAAAEAAPQRSVISERLPYADVNNELVYGHFVFPSDMIQPLPAIIVIHEQWGLNKNVRSMADRLAGEGYIVLAVDLFGGQTAIDPVSASELMKTVVENPQLADENIRQAYEFVSATAGAPRVGSLGWSFGGGWALNTAMMFPNDLDAVVIYYGQVTDDEDQLRPISASIFGFFGADDTSVTVATVERFEAALERLRKDFEIRIYPGGGRTFTDPVGSDYDAEIADDAWLITVDFLAQNLGVANDNAS